MSPERIAEIRMAEQAATPGPWYLLGEHTILGNKTLVVVTRGKCSLQWRDVNGNISSEPSDDWHFIALARTAVPELLAEIERLRCDLPAATEVVRLQDSEKELLAEVERLRYLIAMHEFCSPQDIFGQGYCPQCRGLGDHRPVGKDARGNALPCKWGSVAEEYWDEINSEEEWE